jgi:hypothetical protein
MNLDKMKPAFIIIGLAALLVIAYSIMKIVPAGLGIDWRLTYRPAAIALLHGQNPYDVDVSPDAPFFAAPWGLLPLLPLALLPIEAGRAGIMLIGILVFGYTAYRLGAKPFSMALFLLSPPVIHTILNANIEWLPILGFALPPSIGLFFITIKPQTGFAVGIFWLVEAWRKGGIKQVIKDFAPVTVAFFLSFIPFGLWPLRMFGVISYGTNINSSLWPMSIPIGLVLLTVSLQRRKMNYAMSASPFLSPYVLFHAWSSAVISLINEPLQLSAAVIGLWILVGIRFFS